MHSFTMRPTTPEQRPPVVIPAPIDGAGQELRSEFAVLQARSDALQIDKANAAKHRRDFARELAEAIDAATEADELAKAEKTTRELIADAGGVPVVDGMWRWERQQIRDIGVGLLRSELALRIDVADFIERQRTDVGACIERNEPATVPALERDATNNRRQIACLRRLIRREAGKLAGVG